VSDRYGISERSSGLLVAGSSVGFRKTEIVDLELSPPPATETKPDAVSSTTVPENPYWPSNIQVQR
jgi:hypothetical protein